MSPNNNCFTSGNKSGKLSSVFSIIFILDREKNMNNETTKPMDNTQLLGQETWKMTVKNLKINLKMLGEKTI